MFVKLIVISLVLKTTLSFNTNDLSSGQIDFSNAINLSTKFLHAARIAMKTPGIVAGVSFNGTPVWTEAFGLTDIENDVKTRVDSVWRVGSLSKTFNSALVAHLIDQGLIDLNKSIHAYLKPGLLPIKQWNNKNVTITMGQVLSHTAGFRGMKFPDDLTKNLIVKNVTETVASLKDEPLLFEPGTNFSYSNYGFQLVGAVVEAVLKQTYESSVNKMFKDLEMNSTFCERRETIVPHRARFYQGIIASDHSHYEKVVNTPIFDDLISFEAYWPSGGVMSTMADVLRFGNNMIKWSKGLNTTKNFNISQKTMKTLWTPVIKVPPHSNDTYEYAHGWFVNTLEKPIECSKCKSSPIKQIVWHSGDMTGMSAILVLVPENDIVISYFSNCPVYDNMQLGLSLLRYFTA